MTFHANFSNVHRRYRLFYCGVLTEVFDVNVNEFDS